MTRRALWQPQNPWIDEFYVVEERRVTYFEAPKLRKGSSGKLVSICSVSLNISIQRLSYHHVLTSCFTIGINKCFYTIYCISFPMWPINTLGKKEKMSHNMLTYIYYDIIVFIMLSSQSSQVSGPPPRTNKTCITHVNKHATKQNCHYCRIRLDFQT